MNTAINMLNSIFDTQLKEEDMNKAIEEVVMWNSFEILEFCVKVEQELKIEVNVDDLVDVITIEELVSVVKKWMGN